MQRRGITTRNLMIITAVVGADMAVLVRSANLGYGIEFPLFIAAVLVTLNLFFASYLNAADRINAAPPEMQTEMIVTLGCLLAIIMILVVPIIFVLLVRGAP